MPKDTHIYIHLHRPAVKTGDAGFEESKHKRDDDGKFSSSGGGSGKKGPQTTAGKKEAARREAFRSEADKNAAQGVAKFDLSSLKHVLQRPHQQLTVGRYGSRTSNKGDPGSKAATNLGGFGANEEPDKRQDTSNLRQVYGLTKGDKRNVGAFTATSEKSQFGGYRPVVLNRDGKTARLVGASFETKEQATDYAEYLAGVPGAIDLGTRPALLPHEFPGHVKR